jgi:V8-like Glu-specific endopeptidase
MRWSVRLATAGLLAAVLTGGVTPAVPAHAVPAHAVPAHAVPAHAVPAGRPVAVPFDGLPPVGPLFAGPVPAGDSACTASVVHSPYRNLLLTAAHCVVGPGTGQSFVPMLHRGIAPYGTWLVTAAYADPRWLAGGDPRADYAFLTVAPQLRDGVLAELEDVVGANHLALRAGRRHRATVVGYPAGADRPVACTNRIYRHRGYPAFDCDGYTAGTSGGPWLRDVDPGTGAGTVFGAVGGLHQGGCYPYTSYSPPFGLGTATTYRRAARGLPADVLPVPGGDGC